MQGFDKRDAAIEAIRKDVGSIDLRSAALRSAAMTGEMNLIKGMLGTTLAAAVTILFRVFSH